MITDSEKNLSLSCDECRRLLSEGIDEEARDAVLRHAAACPRCKTEYRLHAILTDGRLPDEVPDGFTESVMRRVRAERARQARRTRIRRIGGAVAAAVILIPAVTVLLPRLRTETAEDHAVEKEFAAEGETMLYSASVEAQGDVVFDTNADMDAPASAADDLCMDALMNACLAGSAPGNLLPPPDYVGKKEPGAETEAVITTMGKGDRTEALTTDETEPAFYDEIRAIVGAEAFDAWLSTYTGDPAEAESAARAYFGIES